MSEDRNKILDNIRTTEARLKEIDTERERLNNDLKRLRLTLSELKVSSVQSTKITAAINAQSSINEKIALFRSLFRGREDVYPKLWTSKKTGNKGYSPVCENEWINGVCGKPSIKCGECDNRKFSPVTDDVIHKHLGGGITIGVYPMFPDETCYFLAIDFDKQTWQDDVKAFMETCKQMNILTSLERSRSGAGGHIWIFFSEPVSAALARQMGSFLITETMSHRHELDMKSYDRLFPNQDTMPKGGFGSLIALPLQKAPAEKGNSLFLDSNLIPYPDQWAYLSNVKRMTSKEVQTFVAETIKTKDIMGISMSQTDEDDKPWKRPLSNKRKIERLTCKLPPEVNAVLANRIYIKKDSLPSKLLNQFKRLAAFQNPEFYKKQSMRFSTALTPRVICCAEDIQNYLTIPRGCLEDLKELLAVNKISLNIQDKRFDGEDVKFNFCGELSDEQDKACKRILEHEIGIFVAPPGIGKTVVGISLIASRGINTLVLVHRKPLLEQWRTQIASFLALPIKDIGQIGGGRDRATNIIDVAMLQSLDKEGGIDSRIKNYGQIIVDECHHISAFSFERVMMEANAKYVTGLTATPYRRDGHQPIITMQCGPVRYKITSQKNSTESLLRYRFITRITNFFCPWADEDKIHNLWPQLIADQERNQMIFDDILNALEEKRSPIILTERKEHLETLKQKLQDFVKNIIVLHGGMKTTVRKEMIAKLAEIPGTEERLIIATGQYIGEGFDDPRLDTLFLAMPFSFKGKMVQYAGRLHRQYRGKTEIRVYDYVDANIPVLLRMHKKRLRAYKALGYEEIIP
mgnify:CR=1 FL=1